MENREYNVSVFMSVKDSARTGRACIKRFGRSCMYQTLWTVMHVSNALDGSYMYQTLWTGRECIKRFGRACMHQTLWTGVHASNALDGLYMYQTLWSDRSSND